MKVYIPMTVLLLVAVAVGVVHGNADLDKEMAGLPANIATCLKNLNSIVVTFRDCVRATTDFEERARCTGAAQDNPYVESCGYVLDEANEEDRAKAYAIMSKWANE